MTRQEKLKKQKYQNYFDLDDRQGLLYGVEIFVSSENKREWDRLQSMKIAVLEDILGYEN